MKQRQHHQQRQFKKENTEPLSNYNILELAAKMKIPHSHGVFMRDTLSKKTQPAIRECWILNHGSSNTNGTHWTALAKSNNTALYFDSFGRLPPPLEVLEYLGDDIRLYYNVKQYQNYGTNIYGHLCLRFLYDFWRNEPQKRRRHEKHIKTRSLP